MTPRRHVAAPAALLTLTGPAGAATRVGGGMPIAGIGSPLDEWMLHPTRGEPLSALAFLGFTVKDRCGLLLKRNVDQWAVTAIKLGVPAMLSWQVLALCDLHLDGRAPMAQVRELTRELMHLAVTGALPISPSTMDEAEMWGTTAAALVNAHHHAKTRTA